MHGCHSGGMHPPFWQPSTINSVHNDDRPLGIEKVFQGTSDATPLLVAREQVLTQQARPDACTCYTAAKNSHMGSHKTWHDC
jgi:hypothetical protein